MTERVDIDYSSTHVSNDERAYHDDDVPTEHDGRSDTRTKFKPSESNDEEHWKELQKQHEGIGDKDRKGKNFDANVKRDVDVFCSTLDCPPHVKDRVHWLVERIDIHDLHKQAPVEAILLATITLVHNEEQGRDPSRDVTWIRQTTEYRNLISGLDIEPSMIRELRNRIRQLHFYESPN